MFQKRNEYFFHKPASLNHFLKFQRTGISAAIWTDFFDDLSFVFETPEKLDVLQAD